MAGHNFGCGSSREHAPAALLACGIQAVIARSFARIFYRNAVNIGLPVLVCEEAVLAGTDGQQIEVDLVSGIIRDAATGQTFQAEPLNPFVARIVAAGGIIEYIRQEGTLR
jgi:3-isopropylmalate/(R)-2-methylmalate dehydratase small subunit